MATHGYNEQTIKFRWPNNGTKGKISDNKNEI